MVACLTTQLDITVTLLRLYVITEIHALFIAGIVGTVYRHTSIHHCVRSTQHPIKENTLTMHYTNGLCVGTPLVPIRSLYSIA